MDRVPELYIGVLGILKIGAIAQPLFSAFGDESLFVRLDNAQTSAIITQRKHAPKVRKILDKLPHLKHIIIVDHDGKTPLREREIAFSLEKAAPGRAPRHLIRPRPNPPRSSITRPARPASRKGVKHVHYSLISQYLTTKWVLDIRDDDIYWCTADPGWVTGTSYGIIGPWSLGVTQCVLDAGFSAEAWYKFIEKYRITNWYSAPDGHPLADESRRRDHQEIRPSSLRHLASVGEPLNPEAVIWSEKVFGKAFLDTYFQTETGSIMITNFPGMKIKPGSMGKPFPGITATVLDPEDLRALPRDRERSG